MNSILAKLLIVCEELEYGIMNFSVYNTEHKTATAVIEDEEGRVTTIIYDEESDSWR